MACRLAEFRFTTIYQKIWSKTQALTLKESMHETYQNVVNIVSIESIAPSKGRCQGDHKTTFYCMGEAITHTGWIIQIPVPYL